MGGTIMQHLSLKNLAQLLCVATSLSALGTVTLAQEVRDVAAARQSVMLLSLNFSRDGSMLITGGDCVRIYDTSSGQQLQRLTPPRLTRAARFSPIKTDLFATAGDDGAIRLWQFSQTDPVRVLKGHSDMV